MKDRRQQERRRSTRYATGTLIITDGITWMDKEGDDRRRKIRRREDRERVAKKVLEDSSQ